MAATAQLERTESGWTGVQPDAAWREEVRRLADKHDAVLLAHNYQLPEIQDIADHTGDSLALSRIAAASDASTIIFCGVHFMAETAKILAPDKRVLIPDARAGCSLADSITGADLFIRPECGCATSARYLAGEGIVPSEKVKILSTGDMVKQAHATKARQVLVATEVGMLHQLRRAAPEIDFRAVNDRASCKYMKMITPAALLRSLREGRDEVHVDPAVAERARASVRRMIEIGQPGGAE